MARYWDRVWYQRLVVGRYWLPAVNRRLAAYASSVLRYASSVLRSLSTTHYHTLAQYRTRVAAYASSVLQGERSSIRYPSTGHRVGARGCYLLSLHSLRAPYASSVPHTA
eukprot:3941017-Rhodomonas_salina.3